MHRDGGSVGVEKGRGQVAKLQSGKVNLTYTCNSATLQLCHLKDFQWIHGNQVMVNSQYAQAVCFDKPDVGRRAYVVADSGWITQRAR